MNINRLVLAILPLFAFSACSSVNSQVTSFHDLTGNYDQASFYMMPLEHQEGRLEYRQYAQSISQRLRQNGYRAVNDISRADIVVIFDYAIDQGQTTSGSYPVFGQTGGGTSYHQGTITSGGLYGSGSSSYRGSTYTPPSYGVVGAIPYTTTIYTRQLTIVMADRSKSTADNFHTVYEANVVSAGSSGSFSTVSECLIDALFDDFPGESGRTRSVTMSADGCRR